MKKALLIIDMQKGSFTPASPRHDTEGVVRRINELAEKLRQKKLPVIYIQHDGSVANAFVPQTPEWEILDELDVNKNDIRIDKYVNDVFYKSKLAQTLTDLKVDHLLITGCATDFCVESTIQSALTKDYDITVIADAHTTGNRPHLNARKIIEHYNWVWQNMIPTKGNISVKKADEINL